MNLLDTTQSVHGRLGNSDSAQRESMRMELGLLQETRHEPRKTGRENGWTEAKKTVQTTAESIGKRITSYLHRQDAGDKPKCLGHCDIVEALETSRSCPICRLTFHAVGAYLDSYLYEGVTDSYFRPALRASRGFCADHAWRLVHSATSSLGMAITYQDVVHVLAAVMRREKDRTGAAFKPRLRLPWHRNGNLASSLAEFVNKLSGSRQCPACEYASSIETTFISFALDLLDDDSVAPRLAHSLCLKHFGLTIQRVRSRKHFDLLVTHQLAALEELEGELAEFVRKNDYRFRDEEFGAEAGSWRRAPLHVAAFPAAVAPTIE